MLDTRPALADMAGQIRTSRSGDGLTLQQLATRSGVAASTIHKVESQQMIPTVSVLLKIAKGLGRRPEELIRDEILIANAGENSNSVRIAEVSDAAEESALADSGGGSTQRERPHKAGVWRVALAQAQALPTIELDSEQRAIVLVDSGGVDLQSGERRFRMSAGDCLETDGGRCIDALGRDPGLSRLTLIVIPPGNLEPVLGAPTGS